MTMLNKLLCFVLAVGAMRATSVSASVFLPYETRAASFGGQHSSMSFPTFGKLHRQQLKRDRQLAAKIRRKTNPNSNRAAVAIPGYGMAEQVFVGGFGNFLSIYNIIITARILLSWFPQAQGVAVLQPVYAITDPYLNLFRGLIPPVFGLDLSPILAFFLLSTLTKVTAAVGAEVDPKMQKQLQKAGYAPFPVKYSSSKKPMLTMGEL